MSARASTLSPILVTFSGPEGAGKTTQKEFVVSVVTTAGLSVHSIHTSRLALSSLVLRAVEKSGLSRTRPRELKLDDGPTAPAAVEEDAGWHERRSTQAGRASRKGILSASRVRQFRRAMVYILDALILRIVLLLPRNRRFDVIVCDRFMYDAMARIVDTYPRIVRLVRRLMPKPDLAMILRAKVEHHSFRRERSSPEYFAERYRQYSKLQEQFCPELVSVGPGDLQSMQAEIGRRLGEVLKARQTGTVPVRPG